MAPALAIAAAVLVLAAAKRRSSSSNPPAQRAPAGERAPQGTHGNDGLSNALKVIGGGGAATTAGLIVAAVGMTAVDAAIGYEAAGPVGGVAGALNPIGAAGAVGWRAGIDLGQDAGLNSAGTTAAGASGAVLGGLILAADLATAALLLPTVGIAVALAELFGAIFGHNPPAPPTAADQGAMLKFIVLNGQVPGGPALMAMLHRASFTDQERINAAAQLVAWAKGPPRVPGPFGLTIANAYQQVGFALVQALGLQSALEPANAAHRTSLHRG